MKHLNLDLYSVMELYSWTSIILIQKKNKWYAGLSLKMIFFLTRPFLWFFRWGTHLYMSLFIRPSVRPLRTISQEL